MPEIACAVTCCKNKLKVNKSYGKYSYTLYIVNKVLRFA